MQLLLNAASVILKVKYTLCKGPAKHLMTQEMSI